MKQEKRHLYEIRDRLLERWPALYIHIDDRQLTLTIYGAEIIYGDALKLAWELTDPESAIHVDLNASVLCSQSEPFGIPTRQPGEPSVEGPRPVSQDERGVILLCKPKRPHKRHGWGLYRPLNPNPP